MKKTAIVLFLLLVGFMAARVIFRPRLDARPYIRMNPALRVLDADGDGAISAGEIARAPTALRTLDLNHDGMLSEEELLPVFDNQPEKVRELVAQLLSFDRNGDGRLARDEVPARMQGLFDRGDKDRDGFLSAAELRELVLHTPPPGQAGNMKGDPVIGALDRNQDGVISKEEMDSAPAVLRSLDRNGDGKLTADEFRALLLKR